VTYTLVEAPAEEPVSLEEAKLHCRVDHNDDDEWFNVTIPAARQFVERAVRRSLVTQTWRLDLSGFPRRRGPIQLAHGPVQSVVGIAYQDGSNDPVAEMDEALYVLSQGEDTSAIWPAHEQEWPDFTAQPSAVQVTFVAGYGGADDVPEPLKHAILLQVGHWNEAREAVSFSAPPSEVPLAFESLIGSYRVPLLA
jgi:uncharacterized phiE125 gp8 family phage protein